MRIFIFLKLTAAPEKIEITDDHELVPASDMTVTKRDGIEIITEGTENTYKRITFETEYGWYQIQASYAESYEDVVEILDWLWDNPLDFSQYSYEIMNK